MSSDTGKKERFRLFKDIFSRGSSDSPKSPADPEKEDVLKKPSDNIDGPCIITPSEHGTNIIPGPFAQSTQEVLQTAKSPKAGTEILHFSLGSDEDVRAASIRPENNGLVHAIIQAYSQHHNLIIRPEDVWFAILTQFSAYINKHAEEMRGTFVSHEGKKDLKLYYDECSRYTMDYGLFAQDMTHLLAQNVIDLGLREWIMPAFSTTTDTDRVVASIVMMGAMKNYFRYYCCITCGIPSVTLLGQKSDYEEILNRVERLSKYGDEPAQFARLLKPVISRFIASFDDPKGSATIDFWQRILDEGNQGSGATIYTGWLVAFCFWDEQGKCLYPAADSYQFHPSYWPKDNNNNETFTRRGEHYYRDKPLRLELDGVRYHEVSDEVIPPGWSSVPVQIVDHGVEYNASMTAGSLGILCSSSTRGQKLASNGETEGIIDTMQPAITWWIECSKEPGTGGSD